MIDFFQYRLIEVLNGMLTVILFWMLVFLMAHLVRVYRYQLVRFNGHGSRRRALKMMYKENKPEIARGTIVSFLQVRTFILWYLRFVDNHGWQSEFFSSGYGSPF